MSQRFACPKCASASCLWEGVEVVGWRSVTTTLSEGGRNSLDREVYWENASPDGSYGCGECGWEGVRQELTRIGVDDQPLVDPIPGQLEIGGAAS